MDAIASNSYLATGISKSLGHIAVHTQPGKGALAARLFELLGCPIRAYPIGNDETFYIVSLNDRDPDSPDNVIFISPVTPQQYALEQEIATFLGVGTDKVNPAYSNFMAMQLGKPEMYLHFGVHFRSLEELEEVIQKIEAEAERDPAFGSHVKSIQKLRAKRGNAEVDARMDASPVFGDSQMECYGPNIVQGHVLTDLFGTGMAFARSVLELDYVFTGDGRERNSFNSL